LESMNGLFGYLNRICPITSTNDFGGVTFGLAGV